MMNKIIVSQEGSAPIEISLEDGQQIPSKKKKIPTAVKAGMGVLLIAGCAYGLARIDATDQASDDLRRLLEDKFGSNANVFDDPIVSAKINDEITKLSKKALKSKFGNTSGEYAEGLKQAYRTLCDEMKNYYRSNRFG